MGREMSSSHCGGVMRKGLKGWAPGVRIRTRASTMRIKD